MSSHIDSKQRLEGIICNLVQGLGISLKTIEFPSNKSHGYMSTIEYIDVNGTNEKGKNIKLHLFCKIAPVTGLKYQTEIQQKFQREIYIYEDVLTSFYKLQEDKNVAIRFKSYPQHYQSIDKKIIILENMTKLGFKMNSNEKYLNYNHVSLILKELGKFHALSFVMRQENRELFNELCGNTNKFTFDQIYREKVEPVFWFWYDKALNCLDANTYEYTEFLKLRNRFYDMIYNNTVKSYDNKYGVIGHCDCWSPNMLFKYEDATSDDCPSEVCLVDWQLAKRSSPAVDVSQVLYCCCDQDLRKRHGELINVYYESFTTFLSQFGLKAEDLFPYQVFQKHLEMFSVMGLCTSIVTIQLTAIKSVPDMHGDLKSNVDPLDIFVKCITRDFQQEIKGVIMDHLQYGYNL